MPGLADDRVGAVFAALADPTRREVVRSLAERPGLTASSLAGELPMTRQAVAKHLSALSGAGLVQARREGRETRYTLTPAPLAGAMEWMAEVGAQWDERLDRLAKRAQPGYDRPRMAGVSVKASTGRRRRQLNRPPEP